MINLTKIELDGLHYTYNLGDAHTRKLPLKEYQSAIQNFGSIFNDVDLHDYNNLAEAFILEYSKLIGQNYKPKLVLLSYASSISMEVVANFLRVFNYKTIALVEPTFDNIPDILVRHGIELTPYCDCNGYRELLENSALYNYCDGIFITLPNNPTGEIINKEEFEIVCKNCQSSNTLLIIDACFRLFSDKLLGYDMGRICDDTKVDYIIIEDTGKYWPLHDLKVGMIACSAILFDRLNNIHSDLLLNVSPFILGMIRKYINIEFTLKRRPIINIISRNRKILKEAIELRGLSFYNSSSTASVEFIEVTKLNSSSEVICDVLKNCGVIALPGTKFYWTGNILGGNYIRIALARTPEYFENSVNKMMEILNKNF